MNRTVVERVERGRWRERIAAAIADGGRFGGAWATAHGAGLAWHALVTGADAPRVLWCEAPDRRVDSIADVVEAANWDEREAHDLLGLQPDGHEPLRALVEHTDRLERWTIPVGGEGVHEVAVGPIHAGVIESGHFRFHVVGERILALDPRLFHKHRGLERAAEGLTPEEGLAVVQRACAACAAANTTAYAHAVEEARGQLPDAELRVARTVLLELERLYNHLHDLGAVCAGVGFAPGASMFAALKDRAQEVNAALTGHRFLFGAVALGAGRPLDPVAVADARATLRELRAESAGAWRDLEFAGSVQARLDGIGILDRDAALRLGATGPAARAAGLRHDVRGESPRLAYHGFQPADPGEPAGDVAARVRMRAAELETTYDLLDDLLARPVAAGAVTTVADPAALGVGRVECPRGATTAIVELDGGRIRRLHLRTASYANWPALAHASAGNLLGEFPLINKSFELCYACVDR